MKQTTTKADARAAREQQHAAAAAAGRRRRNVQVLGGLGFAVVVVVVLAVIVFGGTGGGRDTEAKGSVEGRAATTALLKGIPQDGLALGDPDAPATIVEFLDVQCPICRNHQLDDQPAVLQELVRTGKARLLAQPVTLPMMGEGSVAGRAVALRLARKNRAWEFLNLFYWNQGPEASGYVTDAYLQRLVNAVPGAATSDAAPRTVDAADTAVAAGIDRAFAQQAKKAEAAGVPSTQFGTPWFAVGRTGAPLSTYEPVIRDGKSTVDALTDAVAALD